MNDEHGGGKDGWFRLPLPSQVSSLPCGGKDGEDPEDLEAKGKLKEGLRVKAK